LPAAGLLLTAHVPPRTACLKPTAAHDVFADSTIGTCAATYPQLGAL